MRLCFHSVATDYPHAAVSIHSMLPFDDRFANKKDMKKTTLDVLLVVRSGMDTAHCVTMQLKIHDDLSKPRTPVCSVGRVAY